MPNKTLDIKQEIDYIVHMKDNKKIKRAITAHYTNPLHKELYNVYSNHCWC